MNKKLTWQEMYSYLEQQENCRVNGKGFSVLSLHNTLQKLDSMIKMHKPEDRKSNMYCKSLKGTLERIYWAHKEGNIEPPFTRHENRFSIYGV